MTFSYQHKYFNILLWLILSLLNKFKLIKLLKYCITVYTRVYTNIIILHNNNFTFILIKIQKHYSKKKSYHGWFSVSSVLLDQGQYYNRILNMVLIITF